MFEIKVVDINDIYIFVVRQFFVWWAVFEKTDKVIF
jgi:hypothetical protein